MPDEETYTVTLEPSEKQFEVKEGQTVLDAAIRNGVQIPYSCRHGSCAACKALVLEGEYELMDRVSDYSLVSFERDEGYVLLCSTIPESDLVIEVEEEEDDAEFLPVHDFEAEVVENMRSTRDIHTIRMRLNSGNIPYKAGQYFEFDIPGLEETRAYSMANLYQDDEWVEFHVKRIPNGVGSNYMCDLKPGDRVTGSGPFGKMQLRNRDKDLLFIAGGSGMAPIKALIEALFSESFEREAWFFYGARTVDDLYLMEKWNELDQRYENFHFIPALSDHDGTKPWEGEEGYIADVVAKHMQDMEGMDAYLCGPPIMIETSLRILYKGGVRAADISYDEF